MKSDGYSLDDKRTPLPTSDLPDILARWKSLKTENSKLKTPELARARTDQSFLVPKSEIAGHGYDLSLNRYKEVVHEAVEHDSPREIMAMLNRLEEEIQEGMRELEGMLG
jgi:type I restriction enzyme M protein